MHENVLRKWVKELSADPAQAFPGAGQMKPDQLEIDRLRREVSKLRAERDILKKGPLLTLRGSRYEVRFHREAPIRLTGGMAMRSLGCLAVGLSRLAQAASQRTCSGGRSDHAEGSLKLRRECSHLWRAAGLARCSGRRCIVWTAQDRMAQARRDITGAATSSWSSERRGRTVGLACFECA